MEDLQTSAPARPRGRFRTGVVAALAATAGLVVGGLAFTSTPASGDVASWEAAVLESGFASLGSPFADASYGIDDEGFVHLRGQATATDVAIDRPLGVGTGGPWLAEAFTLDCGYRPEHIVTQAINSSEPVVGLEQYEGALFVFPDGRVLLGGFEIPVVLDGGDAEASFTSSMDSITFEADPTPDPVACPPE